MTRYTLKVKRTHVESDAKAFDVQPLMKKSKTAASARPGALSTNTLATTTPAPSTTPASAAPARSQKATRRARAKLQQAICFRCRKSGHRVADCPLGEGSSSTTLLAAGKVSSGSGATPGNICFRCGSSTHRLQQCKQTGPLRFAECFVCKERGHLSSACPQSTTGLYPNGGGCRYCSSIQHLARDCKRTQQQQLKEGLGVTQLGMLDLEQGADDDDVHVALRHVSNAASAGRSVAKKKVVVFK